MAEEKHGDHGTRVEEKAGEDHGECNGENGLGFSEGEGERGLVVQGDSSVGWFRE